MPETIEERLGSFLDDDPEFIDPPKEELAPPITEELDPPKEQPEEDPPEDPPTEDPEEITISSIGELAEHLGADVADLYNLKVPITKADGTKAEVSIGEWKDSYRETDLVKSERAKFENEMAQAQESMTMKAQNLDAAYVQADAMMKAAEKQLVGEVSALEQLQHTDPTQYVMKKQQLMDKQNEMNQVREQAIHNYQQQQQQLLNEQENARQMRVAQQVSILRDTVPGWKDETVMKSELEDTTNYLLDLGVPQEAIQRISLGLPIIPDATVTAIARKAMLWDKQAKSNPEAKKKVVSIGKKVLKAGKAQTKQTKKQGKYKEDLATARKAIQGRDGKEALANLFENYFLDDM